MPRNLLLVAFFGFLLPAVSLYAADDCQHDASSFRCVEFVRNYDGDTITVNVPGVHPLLGETISIRLNAVDTAEIRTKDLCEKQASRSAKKLVSRVLKQAKRIDLVNIKRGKYFRVVADVLVDGESLKDLLLKSRLAVAYDGESKPKTNWCQLISVSPAQGLN